MRDSIKVSKFRKLEGWTRSVWHCLLVAISLAGMVYISGVYMYAGIMVYREQYTGLFFGLVLAAIFLGVPAKKDNTGGVVPWFDWFLAVLGLGVGLYIAILYPEIVFRLGYVAAEDVVFGVLTIILVLEALRRLVGWVLVIIVSVFLLYGFIAPNMPGMLRGSSTDPGLLVSYLYLDPNSMLSLLALGGTMALAFILFGQVLISFGGADLFNNLAMALFGRFRGGPAKVAVIGSSLVGSITGGPVTNVMLTGNVSIPLMIKTGYHPAQAGAIEAIASSGGQIMPPVMGVAAFVMADYLGISYAEVAIAALLPAILYYVSIFSQVDLLAARDGMAGVRLEKREVWQAIRKGTILIPIFAMLIYLMFVRGLDPGNAGIISAVTAIPLMLCLPEVRSKVGFRIISSLQNTGKMVLEVGVILAAAGLIVGVTGITGLGFNLIRTLIHLGGQNFILLLVLSAVVSIILGMGMPSVAAYSLVAVLVGPAIVEYGVLPIAAHLFIFYFAIVSNFTPPIALACFAAAPLAGADPNEVGYRAMALGVVAYLVPFLFIYSPALILHGSPMEVAISSITAVIGAYFLGVPLVGYLYRKISLARRFLFLLGSLILLLPVEEGWSIHLIINLLGLVILLVLVRDERRHAVQPDNIETQQVKSTAVH